MRHNQLIIQLNIYLTLIFLINVESAPMTNDSIISNYDGGNASSLESKTPQNYITDDSGNSINLKEIKTDLSQRLQWEEVSSEHIDEHTQSENDYDISNDFNELEKILSYDQWNRDLHGTLALNKTIKRNWGDDETLSLEDYFNNLLVLTKRINKVSQTLMRLPSPFRLQNRPLVTAYSVMVSFFTNVVTNSIGNIVAVSHLGVGALPFMTILLLPFPLILEISQIINSEILAFKNNNA